MPEPCTFISPEGKQCPHWRAKNELFCKTHQGTNMDTMLENAAIGDEKTADQVRFEALLIENKALKERAAAATALALKLSKQLPAAAETQNSTLKTQNSPVDPEIEGARLAAELQGQKPQKPRGRKRKPTPAPDLPIEAEGHDIVVRRMQAAQETELALREQRRRDRRRRGLPADEGRVAIEVHLQRALDNDWSAVKDELGNDLREPGYVYRHIRTRDYDRNGQELPRDNQRLAMFKRNYGATIVKRPVYDSSGKKTGEEDWVSGLGVLVKYPVAEYAQRVIDNSPYGSFDAALDSQIDVLDNIAERENSAYGKRGGAVHVYAPEAEHGIDERIFQG